MANIIGNIGGRKAPFSISEHVDSYVIPAGYYARVYVKDTVVRKESSGTGAGHLYLGLTIDGDEAYPVLNAFCTDFDGGNLSGETYILIETSGFINAWTIGSNVDFARMNKVNTPTDRDWEKSI